MKAQRDRESNRAQEWQEVQQSYLKHYNALKEAAKPQREVAEFIGQLRFLGADPEIAREVRKTANALWSRVKGWKDA